MLTFKFILGELYHINLQNGIATVIVIFGRFYGNLFICYSILKIIGKTYLILLSIKTDRFNTLNYTILKIILQQLFILYIRYFKRRIV